MNEPSFNINAFSKIVNSFLSSHQDKPDSLVLRNRFFFSLLHQSSKFEDQLCKGDFTLSSLSISSPPPQDSQKDEKNLELEFCNPISNPEIKEILSSEFQNIINDHIPPPLYIDTTSIDQQQNVCDTQLLAQTINQCLDSNHLSTIDPQLVSLLDYCLQTYLKQILSSLLSFMQIRHRESQLLSNSTSNNIHIRLNDILELLEHIPFYKHHPLISKHYQYVGR